MNPQKRVAILGSTGSIGRSALKTLRLHSDLFQLTVLSAHSNVDLLEAQARRFKPRLAVMSNPDAASVLADRLRGLDIQVAAGEERLAQAASLPDLDMTLCGIGGRAGLIPTFEAARAGIDIAFVNKEALALSGELLMKTAAQSGARILPVDSEMSAVFQCLEGVQNRDDVARLTLTASGGPFRATPRERFKEITPEQALNHPNWDMGAKVTIDSATLMNKGFEAIEARWLFDVELDRIDVVVHPQSIVHSYVELKDGSVLAQMGLPDMRVPIQYALTYPRHLPSGVGRMRLAEIGSLTFEPPDLERFPCLRLAYEAGKAGGTMPAALSGADEAAVDAFLNKKIRFDQIPVLLAEAMRRHDSIASPTLDEAMAADDWAKKQVQSLMEGVVDQCLEAY